MFIIKKCSEVNDQLTYEAFSQGFSDYIVKFNMKKEAFLKHFFGVEGNKREFSFIALKENKPIGLVIGGIKVGEQLKTLRCGGMAVIKSERGTGVAAALMDHHEQLAKELNCKQLFLEVLSNNDRAISFYKKLNYEKVYDLIYRKFEVTDKTLANVNQEMVTKVKKCTYNDMCLLRTKDSTHLPWQVSFEYFKDLPVSYYCYHINNEIVAGLVVSKGHIGYLWVDPKYRLQGIATALLKKAVIDLQPQTWKTFYANNSSIHTFCNKLGMEYDLYSQYEMYKLLK